MARPLARFESSPSDENPGKPKSVLVTFSTAGMLCQCIQSGGGSDSTPVDPGQTL
jgi:hypothetical protein